MIFHYLPLWGVVIVPVVPRSGMASFERYVISKWVVRIGGGGNWLRIMFSG
jgi:hypothetical protein